MNIDMFLVQYGLAAIFILTLAKAIGVPIPIPGDLILLTAAAREIAPHSPECGASEFAGYYR